MQRLRDNPRPLYGHAGVNWSRVIYSARTVSSRLPVLLSMYRSVTDTELLDDRGLILGAARFLLLSDECGSGLRPEADGARPDVSGFEIGLQTWQTFRLAAKLDPGNGDWSEQTRCMERLIASAKPSNTIDAAWRVIALKQMGKPVQAALAELLGHQQADGRFGMEFTNQAPPADFISFHALYAMAVAEHRGPVVDKLVEYALRTQRPDGSWKGAPEYKGFDTPFRETQFAVMARSQLYPQQKMPREIPLPGIQPVADPWRSANRGAIQSDLLRRLAQEREPALPLIEALAASMDENLGQLREWQRIIRKPEDQMRVEVALRADGQRQATLLATALRSGSRNVRFNILAAMVATAGVEGFPARPRVGNDMEAPQILSDAGGALEDAILACFDPADSELTSAAIRAGTALSDVLTPRFAAAILRLPPAFAPVVAGSYGPDRRGRLTLSRSGAPDADLQNVVREVLEAQEPDRLAVVLPLLAALEPGHALVHDQTILGAMERLLRARPDAQVLRAAAAFPNLADGPLMRHQVLAVLASEHLQELRGATDVVLEKYLVSPNLFTLTIQFLAASKGLARRMLLDGLDPDRLTFRLDQVSAYSPPRILPPSDGNLFSSSIVQEFVVSSLENSDLQVQAAALDLTRKQEKLRAQTAIRQALVTLETSPVPRTQLLSRAVVSKQEPILPAESMLDFEFFKEKVQPILQKPGPDGRSCAMCHASNARFPLRADARANFAAAARKVSLLNPAESPLLVKPLLPGLTADGDVFGTAHNGGERWPARTASAEYQAILAWIRGERLATQ